MCGILYIMDVDNEELLRRTYALVVENNKLLKKLRRNALLGTIVKFVFWALVIGVPVWMYYSVLQPMLSDMQHTASQVGVVIPGLEGLNELMKFLPQAQ